MNTDAMNTFRALKDEQLVSPWQCRFGLHVWTKWVVSQPREFAFTWYLPHKRFCIHCNLHQAKDVKVRRLP